jgi:DNA-binding CsgD family transcriptional regulator
MINHFLIVDDAMKDQSFYNELAGMNDLHCHIDNMLESAKASVYWKDKKGKYLGLNTGFTDYLCDSQLQPSDIVGSTDRDFIWAEEAPILEKNDQEVIYTATTKTIVEPCRSFENKVKLFLSHKSPLRSRQGKIIGVFGISYILDGCPGTSDMLKALGFPANLIAFNLLNPVPNYAFENQLTRRQIDCLFYLVKGFTVKQIAKQLSLSPRTVEHYLDAIKIKLKCESKIDLIEKAFQMKIIQEKLKIQI